MRWDIVGIVVGVIALIFILVYYLAYLPQEAQRREFLYFPTIQDLPKELTYMPPRLKFDVHIVPRVLNNIQSVALQQHTLPLLRSTLNSKDSYAYVQTTETELIHLAATKITRFPRSHHEPVVVRCLNEGATPLQHDIDPNPASMNHTRVATFFVYLNEDYAGGELEFPQTKLVLSPNRGQGVLYWNRNKSVIIEESLHRERYICRGSKWVAITYIHSQPFVHTLS